MPDNTEQSSQTNIAVVEQHQENVNKAGEEETENPSGNTFGWTTEDQVFLCVIGFGILILFAGCLYCLGRVMCTSNCCETMGPINDDTEKTRKRRRVSSLPFLISPSSPEILLTSPQKTSNLTQRRTSQEGHQHHKSNQDLTETCFKKVKRKLCTKSNTELSSSKDIVKVTRNYNNYYEKEYSHVSPFSQTNNKPQPQPHNSLEIIESLNVANLQKNLSDGNSKKENNHAQQVLSKWM